VPSTALKLARQDLFRDFFDEPARFAVAGFPGDVGLGDNADKAIPIDDGNAPHLAASHLGQYIDSSRRFDASVVMPKAELLKWR
jgi:hypothetical protein